MNTSTRSAESYESHAGAAKSTWILAHALPHGDGLSSASERKAIASSCVVYDVNDFASIDLLHNKTRSDKAKHTQRFRRSPAAAAIAPLGLLSPVLLCSSQVPELWGTKGSVTLL